jgi:peptidyl-prolyl cis-trans isomerase D
MFQLLRRASQTWLAKLLMIVLVGSFGIWGVSTSLLAPTSNTVITVGDQKVSVSDLHFAFQRQMAALSRQFGTQLTLEQAKAFGVDRQVYAQLSAGAALDQLADDMDLGLSQDRLAALIADDPAFKSLNGSFDRQQFTALLRNAGIREQDYINERSNVAVRSQIIDAVGSGFTPPPVLIDALKQYRYETRSVDYLLLTDANIEPIKAPADDVLQKWFDTVKARYHAPEFRKIAYVKLEPSDIADPSAVTDEAVKQDYEAHKDRYTTAASRTIEQLTFADEAMAEAAAKELQDGKSFDDLIKEQGKTENDVTLGTFTKDRVPDAAIADAAFALDTDGATSGVVKGAFGPVILRVKDIKPAVTKSLDEVKDQVRKDLALNNALDEIQSVHDRYEDLRGGGSSLADAAKELGLKVVTIDAIDADGNGPDGKPIADVPTGKDLVSEAFQTDVGVENLPINVGRNGYLWYEVTDITPDRDRTLDEVKAQATQDWTAEQQKEALGALAEKLKQRVEKGETLQAIADELKIAVEQKTGLTRHSNDAIIGSSAIQEAFSGPVGTVATGATSDGSNQVLLKVTADDPKPATTALDNQDQTIDQMAKAAGDDILDEMVSELQAKYGVSINQQLAEQALVR